MSNHHRLTRRHLLAVGSGALVAATGLGALAGCAGGQAPATAAPEPTKPAAQPAATAAPASKGPVTITWQYWPVGGKAWTDVVEQTVVNPWNKAHPDIQVKDSAIPGSDIQTKLMAQVAAGTAPDLTAIDNYWYLGFAARGAFVRLDDLISRDKYDLSVFLDVALTEGLYKQKRFGIPYIGSTRIIYFNIDLFKAAGVTTPDKLWDQGQWTWDKLVEIGQQLTKKESSGKITQFGILPDTSINVNSPWIWGAGGEILDKDRTKCLLNQPAAVEGLQFQQDMIFKYRISPNNEEMQDIDLFATGKVGLVPSWRGPSIIYRTYNFKWDIVPMPVGKAGKTTLYKGNSMCIPKSSKLVDQAWEFSKWVCGPEAGRVYVLNGGATARKDNIKDLTESKPPDHGQWYMSPLQEGWAKLLPFVPQWTELQVEVDKAFEQIFFEKGDVKQAMDAVAPKVDQILSQPVS